MIQSGYRLTGGHFRIEVPVTCLALKLRLQVSRAIHMLICPVLGKELSIACVTFKS
jgi:hypothetical protein